jgi:hypothetical protein
MTDSGSFVESGSPDAPGIATCPPGNGRSVPPTVVTQLTTVLQAGPWARRRPAVTTRGDLRGPG